MVKDAYDVSLIRSHQQLAGELLPVGIFHLRNTIILRFVTLNLLVKRIILLEIELFSGLMTTKVLDSSSRKSNRMYL